MNGEAIALAVAMFLLGFLCGVVMLALVAIGGDAE